MTCKDCIHYCLCKDTLADENWGKAEIERLNIRNKALTAITKNYDWKFEKVKAEAVKEFAERLKEKASRRLNFDMTVIKFVEVKYIDNLVKETVGDNK